MKKTNMFLALILIALTATGTWMIGQIPREEPPQTVETKLPPSAPTLSAESGFYKDSFELAITARGDEDIYYTLDGSVPTSDSILYEIPIVISVGGGKESPVTLCTQCDNLLER